MATTWRATSGCATIDHKVTVSGREERNAVAVWKEEALLSIVEEKVLHLVAASEKDKGEQRNEWKRRVDETTSTTRQVLVPTFLSCVSCVSPSLELVVDPSTNR